MRHHLACLVVAFSLLSATLAMAVQGTWSTAFHSSGPNDQVECLLRWNDDVYAAGKFDAIGSVPLTCRVAHRHNGVWLPVGDAIVATTISDLCVHDGALHALGKISAGWQVWRLDNDTWQTVGDVFLYDPATLASYEGRLHAGSHRLEAGVWVDRLQTDGPVRSLTVHDGLLVAGGNFSSAAGIPTGFVAAWDGDNVLNAYAGQDSLVVDLEVWDGQLYAARSSGSGPAVGVQVWDGDAWIDIPELGTVDYTRRITDLAAGDGRLLVCGYSYMIIVKAEQTRDVFLKSWNGTTATNLLDTAGARFLTVLDDPSGVLVGGAFSLVGGQQRSNLGLVRDGAMDLVCPAGLAADSPVPMMEASYAGLAIGGAFNVIGGIRTSAVALVDGETWSARSFQYSDWGEGWWYYPFALTWQGGTLYTVAQGHANSGCGVWLGDQWVFGDSYWWDTLSDLTSWQGQLIAPSGGGLTRFSPFADPLLLWDVSGQARVVDVLQGDLVVGGDFTSVDGVAAENLAVNDGSGWQPLGGGLPETVVALGTFGDHVVAAMQGPGGQTDVSEIMIRDEAAWISLGMLTGGQAIAIQEYAGALFVGGTFEMVDDDGQPMIGLACWTGGRWQSVGEAYRTWALAVHDERLWVGGFFKRAGGVPATYLTTFIMEPTGAPELETPPAALSLAAPSPNPFNPRTTLRFELPRAAHATVEIFDAAGRRVATVLDETRDAGRHAISWHGSDDDGRALPSGTYLVRLRSDGVTTTTKATLVR